MDNIWNMEEKKKHTKENFMSTNQGSRIQKKKEKKEKKMFLLLFLLHF